MATITAAPTPLPTKLLPQGPDKWSKGGHVGTVTLVAKPDQPFILPKSSVTTEKAKLPKIILELTPKDVQPLQSGSSFDDALAAAAKISQRTDNTTAILQATDGAFYLAKLVGNSPIDPATGRREQNGVPLRRDYELSLDRELPTNVASLDFTMTEPDVKALVGALTWVDTRTQATHTIEQAASATSNAESLAAG
jgi:hypothetical protein